MRSLLMIACVAGLAAFAAKTACGEEYMRVDGAADAPLPGVAVRTDMLADAAIWRKPEIYRNALVFTQECGRVSVVGKVVASGTYDTAWGLMDINIRILWSDSRTNKL